MTIDLTDGQAEEVIICLAMRCAQRGLSVMQRECTAEIGDYLATVFGERFGWDPGNGLNVFRAHLAQRRTVIVR